MATAPANPVQSEIPTGLKIFLSHSKKDERQVRDLFERLKTAGFDPWMDLENLNIGDRWRVVTEQAIYEADAVIACISRNTTYEGKGFLEEELGIIFKAAATKDWNFIIPVRLEEWPVPKSFEPYYYVDLFTGDGYERLVATLRELERYRPRSASALSSVDLTPGRDAPNQVISPPPVTSAAHAPATNEPAPDSHDPITEQVEPEKQAQAQPTYSGTPLRQNSTGDDVTEMQRRLKQLGFDVVADGLFGPGTQRAVLDFQRTRNLENHDGIVGPGTWAAMFATVPEAAEIKTPEAPAKKAEAPAEKSREGLAEDARERRALNDKPIDDVNEDTLGFKDYVFALREFIASQSTTTPLTISINGAWGSGKSSLMRMLKKQLEPELPPGLWKVQLKWLAGWFSGTLWSRVGQLAIKANVADSRYIKLGLAFEPGEDVTGENFDPLLSKWVDYQLRDLAGSNGQQVSEATIDEHRKLCIERSRFWAGKSVQRRKMTPPAHPTVWFNAWKFNQQEQVWAALATAVLEQLTTKYGFFSRLLFLSKLTWKRTDKLGTISLLARKFIVPIVLAAVVVLYQLNRQRLAHYLPESISSGTWLWLAPLLTAMWQAAKAIKDPFKLPLDELVSQPDYKGKIGFIGSFEADFGRIVEVAIRRSIFWQPRKLIVFIDDLDRCSPIQAAGIVEAINLFLDSVGCVFVLGMDMNAVAISIEVKYKELTERMRKDAPDDIAPGVLFLDKIVQIPFNVPRPNKPFIQALIKKITEPERRDLPAFGWLPPQTTVAQRFEQPVSAPASTGPPAAAGDSAPVAPSAPAPKIDRAGFAQEDIREAIGFAANLLKENPRMVKRFINLFRLQVYIAHERGMLSDLKDGLSPRTLAVWVAWYMQWPEILKMLTDPASTEELSEHLDFISERTLQPAEDNNVSWRLKWDSGYQVALTEIRTREKDSSSHWSRLPWHLWIRDGDFLHCLKELERYWQRPQLLESMLDMTQVTISQNPLAPVASPALVDPKSTGPINESAAVA
jgi:hypothetical protein